MANVDVRIGIPAKEESQSFLLETKDKEGNTHRIMAAYAFIIEPPTEPRTRELLGISPELGQLVLHIQEEVEEEVWSTSEIIALGSDKADLIEQYTQEGHIFSSDTPENFADHIEFAYEVLLASANHIDIEELQ